MSTTDHPLGDVDQAADPTAAKSIVDQVLNLDELLAADVRLAEKSYRFSIRPDLEAVIEDLHAELDALTDSQGRPLATDDDLAGTGRSAAVVNSELVAATRDYAASMRRGVCRAMDEDDWVAFQQRWKTALENGAPFPVELYEDLIVRSALTPKFTVPKLQAFRKKVGHPAFTEVAQTAWAVNTQSGVSVPKSPLSSLVARHLQHG